jgi:hypothetical protein
MLCVLSFLLLLVGSFGEQEHGNNSSVVNVHLGTSKVHELFVKHYPGGRESFLEAVRERAEWSPLQIFEYMHAGRGNQDPKWGGDHGRFDAMGPVLHCPSEIFESFGEGDGEKRICGSMIDDDCVVISIGSYNQWDFEEAVIAKYPHCKIHTFDCYVTGVVPDQIKDQVTFYPLCIGVKDEVIKGHEFLSWPSVVKKVGLTKPPTAMKMDIEGFEWTVIPAVIKSNVLVPESFSFELHFFTHIPEIAWCGRGRTPPEIGLFMEFLFNFGYVLVDRHDNPFCPHCTEIVIAKLLPNFRFAHHGAQHVLPGKLGVLPFPTRPYHIAAGP